MRILKNKINYLKVFNYVFLIINIVLIVIPFVHYWSIGFQFDVYFFIVSLMNIVAFYVSYLIVNKLNYYTRKYYHFENKLLNE